MDIRTLQSALARLAEDRADDPLQAPKNIALSLGAEAGILLSLFRGLAERQGLEDDVSREVAAEALTSILVHVAQLANHVGLDASAGLRARIKGRPSPPLSPPNTVPVIIPRSSDARRGAAADADDDADTAPPAPAAAKTEAAGSEPAKVEAAAPIATNAEPAKGEPATVEPAKVETAKVKPATVEPAKVEVGKVETAKAEPAKVEPAKIEPAKAEAATAAPAKAEAAKESATPEPAAAAAPLQPPEPEQEKPESGASSRTEAAGKGASRKRGGSGVVGVKVEAAPKPAPAPTAAVVEVIEVDEPAPAPVRETAAVPVREPYHALDTDTVLEFTKAVSRELDRSTRDDPVLRELRDEIETLRRSLYASNTKKAWIAGSLRSVRGHLEETLSHSFSDDLRSMHFIGRIDTLLAD